MEKDKEIRHMVRSIEKALNELYMHAWYWVKVDVFDDMLRVTGKLEKIKEGLLKELGE